MPKAILAVTVTESLPLLTPVVKELQERGWQARVVASPPTQSHPIPDGVETLVIPMSRGITPARDVRALARWIRLLRRERPDLVLGSTPKAAMLSVVAARIVGIPCRVFLVRGARWDGMTGRKARLLMKLDALTAWAATNVVAVSQSLAHLLVERGVTHYTPDVIGRGGSKGVDVHRFRPRPRNSGQPPTVGFVGRLAIDKGILDLLQVFDECRSVIPDLRLLVIGSVDEAQPIGESLIERLRSDPGIDWLGPTAATEDVVPTFDVLVFPSVREGLPNVVIEAAASGVPVVAYITTGLPDAVIDHETGYLAPLGDVWQLSKAALRVLESDHSTGMGQKARDFAVRWFSQDKVVPRFVDYLERSLEESQDSKASIRETET